MRVQDAIDAAGAEKWATTHPAVEDGDPQELVELSARAVSIADTQDWRSGLYLGQLTLALCETGRPRYAQVRNQVRFNSMATAEAALRRSPDGDLLRAARAAGDRALADGTEREDAWAVAEATHRIGLLYLGAYTTRAPSISYGNWLELWRQQADVEWSRTGVRPAPMPSAAEALAESATWLRSACELRDGHDLGLASKALCQCLIFQNVVRREELAERQDPAVAAEITATEAEIESVGDRALRLLAQFDDPVSRLALLAMLGRGAQDVAAEARRLTEPDWRDIVEHYGISRAVDLVKQGSSLIGEVSPLEAASLLVRHRDMFKAYSEDSYSSALESECVFLGRGDDLTLPETAPETVRQTWTGEVMAAESDRVLAAHAAGGLSDGRAFAAFMQLASYAIAAWTEQVGLGCVARARQAAPALAGEYAEAVAWRESFLQGNLADDGYAKQDWAASVTNYARALSLATDLGLTRIALKRLDQLADIFASKPVHVDVVRAAAIGLLPLMAVIDVALGPGSADPLAVVFKRGTLALVAAGDFPVPLLSLLWQCAKGLRMSSLLAADPPPAVDSAELFGAELAGIENTRAQLAATSDGPDAEPPGIDEELLLAAYTRPGTLVAGGDPASILSNTQHRVDELVERALLDRLPSARTYVSLPAIQAALPEHMVLMDTFVGTTEQNKVSINHLIVTREELLFGGVRLDLADGAGTVPAAGRQVVITELGTIVASLRQELVASSDGLQVSAAALQALRVHERGLLGQKTAAILQRLGQQGKTHLCLVPHGPLRYFPWHLIGEEDSPLGSRLIVTYLPTLAGLIEMRSRAGLERDGLVAFGLGFEHDPRGWPHLPRAVEEASRVAAATGGRAVPEPEATKAAVVTALKQARWVHLATHGVHDASAPAFQRIILSGEAGSEGELAAHEVLGLDLRGLDVVSLSACETALGRFDQADNIRGLPASLMIAGASVVVGTLWPVRDSPSADFFEAFYTELARDHDALRAFGEAQRAIRARYPNHADWGAFYYMGHVLFPPSAAAQR